MELTVFPHVCSTLFSCFADREKCKVLTVVLKRHMSEEEDADLAYSTFSSNYTHIFHSEKKHIVSKNNVSHHILLQRFPWETDKLPQGERKTTW